jgi:hypothetical protein
VETIYDRRWVHEDPAAMADWIDEVNRSGCWEVLGRAAKEQVRASFDVPIVATRIRRLLVENAEPLGDESTMAVPVAALDDAWPRTLVAPRGAR